VNVLALNAGSSSLKLAVFAIDGSRETCVVRKEVARAPGDAGELAEAAAGLGKIDAVGHRLVHGGPDHSAPVRVDPALRAAFEGLVRFAPLHLPTELALLDAASARWPDAPQVACFDTAFHRTMPQVAERFALPYELFDAGVRRYGFHGLSYEYVVESVGAERLGRAVIAHLGSGASMAAVRDGKSIDTTMGLTPAGGLVMGTRTGDLDPGVVLHLMGESPPDYQSPRHRRQGQRDLETLVNERSGLLGVSGTTSDMKTLLERSPPDPRAALAVEMFCYVARKFVGALATTLGGIDALVFTGGIGERAAPVRERICDGLGHLGMAIDPARNARSEACISQDSSACRVLVVPTDEERMIARHTARIVG
jgi:acetate kinase